MINTIQMYNKGYNEIVLLVEIRHPLFQEMCHWLLYMSQLQVHKCFFSS